MNRISATVCQVCKQLGIDYHSINPQYVTLIEDATRLGAIYRQLKEIIGDLKEIEDRHQVNGLSKLLDDDILALDKIDHDIIRLAQKLRDQTNTDKREVN